MSTAHARTTSSALSPADAQLVSELFVPELAGALLEAGDDSIRTQLLRQRIRARMQQLPALCHAQGRQPADDEDLAIARELCEFRMPLADGSSLAMGLPYDWYFGVSGDHVGPRAPRFIVPRIAFANTLARAFVRTRDPRYARALRDYIIDYVSRYWVDSTDLPPQDNWLCTSCRGGTWYCPRFGGIYCALSHPDLLEAFSFADLLAVFRAIDRMMTGLIPNLALGSNWRVHELSNLFTQGLSYPFLRHSEHWLTVAVNGLNEEFDIEFADDGSHEELCVEYGTGTWWVFANYYALAAAAPETGLRFSAQRMARCLDYFLSARKPFGLAAAIGDAYSIRSAAMLDPAAQPHADDQLPAWSRELREAAGMLADAGLFPSARFILNQGPPPAWTSRRHADSGHLFLRDGWHVHSLWASFNVGHYANCHCHLGLLGIELAGLGREWLVDAGCSALDDRPTNANLARTRAHNTLCVDDCDQLITAPAVTSRLILGEQYDFAVGVYRGGFGVGNPFGPGSLSVGQFRSAFPATHFRHLLFVKGSYWVLFDALVTAPGRTIQTRLHFMPTTLQPTAAGGYQTRWASSNLALLPLQWQGWTHQVLQGSDDPIEGWLPGPGGELVPAPVYKACHPSQAGPVWHGSLLFPFRGASMPRVEITPLATSGAGFGYRIATDDYTDYLFLSNSWQPRAVQLDSIRTNAPLLHLRLRDGQPTQGCACEGSYLDVGPQRIFDAPGTMLAREFTWSPTLHTCEMQPRLRP